MTTNQSIQFRQTSYFVGAHFLSAIINGDETGLDDTERADLALFLTDFANLSGHWSTDYDGHDDFRRCEISGLMGNCAEIIFNARVNTAGGTAHE